MLGGNAYVTAYTRSAYAEAVDWASTCSCLRADDHPWASSELLIQLQSCAHVACLGVWMHKSPTSCYYLLQYCTLFRDEQCTAEALCFLESSVLSVVACANQRIAARFQTIMPSDESLETGR